MAGVMHLLSGCCEAEMRSGNRNKVISLLWMGCDSNNGNPVSSRTVIPEDPSKNQFKHMTLFGILCKRSTFDCPFLR